MNVPQSPPGRFANALLCNRAIASNYKVVMMYENPSADNVRCMTLKENTPRTLLWRGGVNGRLDYRAMHVLMKRARLMK